MQGGPQANEVLKGLDGYEQMMNTFSEQAKIFWRAWGPAGEPIVQGIEAWAQMKRGYLQWLRQTFEVDGRRVSWPPG